VNHIVIQTITTKYHSQASSSTKTDRRVGFDEIEDDIDDVESAEDDHDDSEPDAFSGDDDAMIASIHSRQTTDTNEEIEE
jgi:hypothetical protein